MKQILYIILLVYTSNIYAQNSRSSALIQPKDVKERLMEVSSKLSSKYEKNYNEAIKLFPVSITTKQGKKAILQGVDSFGYPIYISTFNLGATTTARANHLFDGGSLGLNLTGNGLTVGVWELGFIRGTHESLANRVNNVENGDFSDHDQLTDHATHVSGTIAGNGLDLSYTRGFAVNALVDGYLVDDDLSEMANAASNGLLVSNHSYGIVVVNDDGELVVPEYSFGKYENKSRSVDNIVYLSEYYQPVFAAGNNRNDDISQTGYDLLHGKQNSKNALVVAAVSNVSNYTGPESVSMSSFSNWGPTDDGRIKPDISSKGVNLSSASSSADDGYSTKSGTSMAAPGIAGVILLLQEHNYNVNGDYLKSASIRGLLAHTADECNTNFFGADGPDYKYGWGLVNAKNAIECISNNGETSLVYEGTLEEGQSYELSFDAIGGEDIIATLSWTDPEGEVYSSTSENMLDYRTPVLVNDMDLRVSKNETIFYPWKLYPENPSSPAIKEDNSVDNIEKVEISNPSGTYNFTVNHKGLLLDSFQNFSLTITGVNTSTFSVEDKNLNTLNIWPNPAKETLHFKFASTSNAPCLVQLVDLQGRTVFAKNMLGETNLIKGQLNTSNYEKGVYVLNLKQGSKTTFKKVIIQ